MMIRATPLKLKPLNVVLGVKRQSAGAELFDIACAPPASASMEAVRVHVRLRVIVLSSWIKQSSVDCRCLGPVCRVQPPNEGSAGSVRYDFRGRCS